jgi:uncharacterized membrane protein
MIHIKKSKFVGLENKAGGKFPARRLIVPVLFTMIFLASLLVVVTEFSENAEAGGLVLLISPDVQNCVADTLPQKATFTVQIKNDEPSQETVDIDYKFISPSPSPYGWTVQPSFDNYTFSAGETHEFLPQVLANKSVAPDIQVKVQVTVKFQDGNPPSIYSTTFTAISSQWYDVLTSVKDNDNAKTTDPGGDPVVYNITVENKGNGQDRFIMSVSGLPTGWDPPAFGADPLIDPGVTQVVGMTLNTPSDARGKMHAITVIATSDGKPSVQSSTQTYTTVTKYFSLSVTASPDTWQEGLPGTPVKYSLTVENLGNADDEVKVSVTNLEGLTWLTSLSPGNQRIIKYRESFTWNLTVLIPDEAKNWELGKVRFNATSIKPGSKQDSTKLIIQVGEVYGTRIYIPTSTNITDPGNTVYYTVQVTNTGNTNDTITLESSGEFASNVKPSSITDLSPDTTVNVTLEVDVPSGALAGFHYNTITATSEIPTNTANGTVRTEVNPVYDVVISASGQSAQDGEPGGDPVLYQVKVWNKGTANDSISLTIEGEKPGWAGLDNYEVEVPAKSFVIVNMTVEVPSGEPINSWTITVKGDSSEEIGEWDTQDFIIRVLQTYKVSVSTGKDKNSVPAGGTTQYYMNVKNTGSGYDDFTVNTWVENPLDPATTWSSVSPDFFGLFAGENITVVVTVEVPDGAVPGNYFIQFNATSDNITDPRDTTAKRTWMTITEVTDRYEVVIAGQKERTLEAPEDVNVTYILNVYNFGTGNDTFEISASGDQTGWITLSTSLINNLPPSGQYNLSVTVNIKDANNASMADGVHNLKITITSKDDPVTPKSSDSVWLNTSLTATRDATLSTQQDVLNAEPGDTIYFIVNITNTGSTQDTFEIVDDGPYKGWGTIPNQIVILNPDQSTQITYEVDVSQDITRDKSPAELYLWAKSLGGNEEVVDNLTLYVNINKTFGVSIFTTTTEQTGDPGQTIDFIIEIKNEGNDEDDIILSHSGPELGTWNMSVARLQPDQSRFAKYNITIDPKHDITDIVIILNASSDGDDTDQTYMTKMIIVHVNPHYEVQLLSQQNQKDVRGGENVTFSLGIKNTGTDVDTFDLKTRGLQGFWATINPSDPTNISVVVNVGETKFVDILVSPPEDTLKKLYNITINVTSQNDNSLTAEYTFYANVIATYDVFISADNPHQKVPAGDPATFTMLVENKGNADDKFQFYETGLPPGWTISIQPSTLDVPAGETRTVSVTVDTSEGSASGGYEFNFTARSINPPNPESTTKLIVEVDQVYKVEISAAIAQKSVDVNDYIIYNVEIKNSGNGEDIFELSLSGTQANWASLYYNQTEQGDIIHISPPPRGSLAIKLNVSIPSRTAWKNVGSPTTLQITLEAESIVDPGATPASATKLFTTTVNNIYEVSLKVTSSSRSGIPGDTVSFPITVYNDGTTSDEYHVEIEEFNTYLPNVSIGLWDDENPGPFSPSPPIGPITDGGSQVVTMEITIPNPVDSTEIPTGDYYIRVKVTSKDKSTVWANWTFTVKVKQLYYAWITDSVTSASADVGGSAEYQLQVQNKGNKQDTITFEIGDDPNILLDQSGWAKIMLGGQEITNIVLNASESKFVYLNVSIPERGGLPSPEPTSVSLKVKVKPSEPGATGAIEDELQVTTNINAIYSFDLTSLSPQNKKEADAGEQITFTLQVRNSGTVTDTYKFRASNFDETTFSIGSISPIPNLAPDSYGTTIVDITIDPDADLGVYIIEITVESDKDPSVKGTLNLTVDITGPIYSFTLTTPTPLNTLEGEPGDSVQFTLEVRNIGTHKDTYNFRVTKYDSNIFTVPEPSPISSIDVDNFGTTKVTISITTLKEKALKGLYEIEVTATSDADPGVSVNITLIVDVTASAEVELTPASQQDDGEPEESIDYIIKITNKGNARDTFDLSVEGTYKDWAEIYDRSGLNKISEVTLNETDAKTGGHFMEIIVRVTIPGTGETDAGQIYPVTLKAASRNTEDIEDTAQVSTRVEDYVDLILEYSGSGAPKKDFDPNKQSPKFSLRVTNNGNQEETGMQIRVDDIEDDWTYTPEQLSETLEAGGTLTFSIEFNIPPDESEGEYLMQVYIISAVDLSIESNPVLITVNITKPDLSVSSSDVSIPDREYLMSRIDNSATITATIHNDGHSKAESIQVKLWEGPTVIATKTISSIDPGDSKDVDFRWTVVAEEVEIKVEVTAQEEIDDGNNAISPIFVDLRPDLSFTGEQLNFTKSNPSPGEKITITAFIENTGGDAEGVVVRFSYGTKTIGSKNIDIDNDETGEVTFEWTVPDKPGDTLKVKAEIDLDDAIGDGEDATKSIKISGAAGVAGLFTGTGLTGMGIGLIIGAILFLIIGLAIGRRGAAARRGPEGMVGPSFGAFEKELPEGAEKKAPKPPAPFERTEEEAPPEEEEKAKPKEVARVRCPKCGKVTEVTSTQRPLQIPCECGTTLMLKK